MGGRGTRSPLSPRSGVDGGAEGGSAEASETIELMKLSQEKRGGAEETTIRERYLVWEIRKVVERD